MVELSRFAERLLLARAEASKNQPENGLCGLEIEWNLLDSKFRPLLKVGSGAGQQSFVDYLRSECLSPRLRKFSQLEVFHWMIEWATRPHYHPNSAIFEARLMEAVLINALHKAGQDFEERLYMWHGNLPVATHVSFDSIPGSWHLAKRRYLERCVQKYGQNLATTGTHSNLSLPDPLFEWDFMRLPAGDRTGGSNPPLHLDEFKSQFYITATRLMRPFAALFIATSASTPFRAGMTDDEPVVFLTGYDSVRNLTFPNPAEIDLPDLYRSLDDYLRISYDLVRRGVRFGNNNWTPVRARSFAEPVERLIDLTSDQLQELYARGLFVLGEDQPLDDLANQIEIQNLLARINIPMARVEIRTDDGGNPFDVDAANLTLKYLLLARIYADPEFARAFRYDREDIQRARKNEEQAARSGLRAEIENPFTGKPLGLRSFLEWTLGEVTPLAELLGLSENLTPLGEMAAGRQTTAEMIRSRVCAELGVQVPDGSGEIQVPVDLLRELAEEREEQVRRDVEMAAEVHSLYPEDSDKLSEFIQFARDEVHLDPKLPIRFRPRPEALIEISYPDKTSEILALAGQLIEIPSVTACPDERLDEVRRAATFVYDFLSNHGLSVRYFDRDRYPALLVEFPGQMPAPVLLVGHLDVVQPDPDDSQFSPRIEGDYLWGRGAADMKTVVATCLVWMKDRRKAGGRFPRVSLLLVGNEENGEQEAAGTPHVLRVLEAEDKAPRILIAGERTGEKGNELWGEICTENRGLMRFEVAARGNRGHTGVAGQRTDVIQRLIDARTGILEVFNDHLTLEGEAGWQSQAMITYIEAGTPGVFNITADLGRMGFEVRSIPGDDLNLLAEHLDSFCKKSGLLLDISVLENGVACDPENPYLKALIRAVHFASGSEPRIGKKLPGTSARFAPGGQGVVWGQSGIGPHTSEERHFIPSILPYYRALDEYAGILTAV
jgi:succinyl-diaminopimelate desuccinylase